MKNKSEAGATGMDVVSGIIIFVVSTAVVISLYYQIYIVATQIKVHQFVIGCITEIFEKIDLESYENITEENVKKLIEESDLNDYFNEYNNYVECSLIQYSKESGVSQDLIKKVNITVTYTVGNNTTTLPLNKIKIRE